MKRSFSMIIALTLMLSVASCSSSTSGSTKTTENIQTTEEAKTVEPARLINKMTAGEFSKVNKHALTILDEPEIKVDPADVKHKVSVEYDDISVDEMEKNLEKFKNEITPEEYSFAQAEIDKYRTSGESFSLIKYILVDGKLVQHNIPRVVDPEYTGGSFSFRYGTYDDSGNMTENEFSFASFDEYCDWIRKTDKEKGVSDDDIENNVKMVRIANDAITTGDFEKIPAGTVDVTAEEYYGLIDDPNRDYRKNWEFDRDAVAAIKDSIDEINIYDEELDVDFLVHVTLPPDYDKDKTYPVFFLTDGVWRFGNHTQLRKLMEDGEAAPVILVSLGYNYSINGADLSFRNDILVTQRYKLLDFVTDNLMPYLGENYNIDFANSTLYGHSDGGVFAETAMLKSDLYENQPFGNYIIGSPAFWGLYFDSEVLDSESYEKDYGYFERNDKLTKKAFLCGGLLEDPDYAERYNGHDTTLEGLKKLKSRLEEHGADITYKIYDSRHYQYIPEMLKEYLKITYPYS